MVDAVAPASLLGYHFFFRRRDADRLGPAPLLICRRHPQSLPLLPGRASGALLALGFQSGMFLPFQSICLFRIFIVLHIALVTVTVQTDVVQYLQFRHAVQALAVTEVIKIVFAGGIVRRRMVKIHALDLFHEDVGFGLAAVDDRNRDGLCHQFRIAQQVGHHGHGAVALVNVGLLRGPQAFVVYKSLDVGLLMPSQDSLLSGWLGLGYTGFPPVRLHTLGWAHNWNLPLIEISLLVQIIYNYFLTVST